MEIKQDCAVCELLKTVATATVKVNNFLSALESHHKQVRGLTAGEKMPMVYYVKQLAKDVGIGDMPIATAIRLTHGFGVYNDSPIQPFYERTFKK